MVPHKYLAWLECSSQYLPTNANLFMHVPSVGELESAIQSYYHIPECALKTSFQHIRRSGSVAGVESKE